MDSRGSRRCRAGPLGPLTLRALAALLDKGLWVRGCGGVLEAGARVYFFPGFTGTLPSWLIPKPAPPPSPHQWLWLHGTNRTNPTPRI